jgi:AcrR family transcriptional regulator
MAEVDLESQSDVDSSGQQYDRASEILAAACKVIARTGARRLSLEEVGREAGVSKALVLYYFRSRKRLLASAYLFADARGLQRVRAQVEALPTAAQRLEEVLRLYFANDSEILEEWVLWSELRSGAVFEPELRATVEQTFSEFSHWLEGIVADALEDGSIDPATDPHTAVLELMAVIDGLAGLMIAGLVSHEQAQEIVSRTLHRQLHWAVPPSTYEADGADAHALGIFVRDLLRRVSATIQDLNELSGANGESEAIQRVSQTVDEAGRTAARAIALTARDPRKR